MSETRRIAGLLRAAFEGEAWHGPAVKEALAGVGAAQAAARPIARAHTIWEIASHIAAWENVVLRRLAGERVELSDAEDWPRAGDGGEAWLATLVYAGNPIWHREGGEWQRAPRPPRTLSAIT